MHVRMPETPKYHHRGRSIVETPGWLAATTAGAGAFREPANRIEGKAGKRVAANPRSPVEDCRTTPGKPSPACAGRGQVAAMILVSSKRIYRIHAVCSMCRWVPNAKLSGIVQTWRSSLDFWGAEFAAKMTRTHLE